MAEEAPRRRSCLGRTLASAYSGMLMGGALGGILASQRALELGLAGGGGRLVLLNAVRSGLSFASFLATYNGGTCVLENARGKRDVFNPFVVGGGIGLAGALPGWMTPLPHAPWTYRNNRALVGAGLSSALLCSFFYMLSAEPSRQELRQPTTGVAPPAGQNATPPMLQPVMPPPVGQSAGMDFYQPPPLKGKDYESSLSSGWMPHTPESSELDEERSATFGKEDLIDKWATK